MLHQSKHVGAVGSNFKHSLQNPHQPYRRGLEATTRVCPRFRRNLRRGVHHITPDVDVRLIHLYSVHGFEHWPVLAETRTRLDTCTALPPALSTYRRQTRQETAHSQSAVTGETTWGAVRRVMAGGRSPIRPSNPFGCARPDAPTLRAPIGQPVASQAVSVMRRPPRCALRSGVAHHHTTFCPTNGSWKKKSLVPPARCTQQIPCITDMPAPPAFRSSQPPVPGSQHEERNHPPNQRWPVGRREILGVCLCTGAARAGPKSKGGT